ncbi:MAG: MlaD family protein [Segniliparus sp.]|uniref:MlaD family protein n=1 Tax=Segniliparus sp. TaxID=2804064 RepID=UPI003F36270E
MKLSDTKTARVLLALVGALAMGLASACSLDPTEIPLPGTRIGDASYPINIEFASVLSLNAKARVDSDGVQIGTLDHVKLVGNTAVAVVDIFSNVKLPQNTHAEIRQSTILGDLYIALTPPNAPSPTLLRTGDTIPLANTAPPDSIEDLLRSVSSLVNGTSLTGLSDAFASFHKVFGENPEEIAELQKQLADMLHDVADNQAVLDRLLASADAYASTAAADMPAILDMQANLRSGSRVFSKIIVNVARTYIELGNFFGTLNPLVDRNVAGLDQALIFMTPLVAAISTSDTNLSVLLNRGLGLFRDAVVAYFWKDGGPRVTVNAVNVPDKVLVLGGEDPQDRADEMITTMQTMGLLPQ